MCFLDRVYKTFIISTIVDPSLNSKCPLPVYKTFIISTIVDPLGAFINVPCL